MVQTFERIPRGNLGHGPEESRRMLYEHESSCERDYGHRLRIDGDRIECAVCGAEWKDLKLA